MAVGRACNAQEDEQNLRRAPSFLTHVSATRKAFACVCCPPDSLQGHDRVIGDAHTSGAKGVSCPTLLDGLRRGLGAAKVRLYRCIAVNRQLTDRTDYEFVRVWVASVCMALWDGGVNSN